MCALHALYESAGGAAWTSGANANWLQGDPCADAWGGLACTGGNVSAIELDATRFAMLTANAALPAQSEGVEVGSSPAYEFRQPILNGMGAKSLADLKGKPTLIDFWGTR